jgi:SAM-dependent methyltransferase
LIVDIGAGQQTYRSRFEIVADRIIAVEYPDPSPKKDVDVWGDIQHLPIRDGVADTVLCFNVLEIVNEPASAMKEMERILKPGGKLLLVAAQIRGASNESNDYWRFGRPGIRLLAEKVGLEELELKPCGGLFAALGQRASTALHQALVKNRRWPHRVVALLCGFVQAPCWLLDQLGFAKDDTLHWSLVAQKPLR